mmetsp:Transcript_1931/g.5344  ORF Transcript_1931/g.5344 Transcript_1931/m.5344 type:complete len:472 (+) Transcript_1931:675-2090(+)
MAEAQSWAAGAPGARPSRRVAAAASAVAMEAESPVRLRMLPPLLSRATWMAVRSARTLPQSSLTRVSRARMYSRLARPPICSLTHPATVRWAPRRRAAKLWPALTMEDSWPALVSRTICRKRSWSSNCVVVRMSLAMLNRSPVRSAMALPRTMILATGVSEPRLEDTRGDTEMPPVLRPMRSVSSMKDSSCVPIWVRQRQNRGSRGSSSAGTASMLSPTSAYTMPPVGRSCLSTRVSPKAPSSTGMAAASRGMSSSEREGTHLRASASSGVSWCSFSSLVDSTIELSCSGVSPERTACSRSFSSWSCLAARVLSGSSSIVTRWGLDSRYWRMRSPKTSSPPARRVFRWSRSACHFMGWNGSFSYSQLAMLRSIRLRPRGNDPVLFSRRLNSIVLMAASTCPSVNPSTAIFCSASITSASTLGRSSTLTPFRPTPNVGCRSSSSRPPPVTASPRPESMSALNSGAARVPSIR